MFVDGAIVHLVAVRKTFRMPTRVIREPSHILGESRRPPLEDRVGRVAPPHADLVRVLELPLQRSRRPVDPDVEAALPAGSHL